VTKEKLIQTSHSCKEVSIQKNINSEETTKEILAEETPIAIIYNGVSHVVMMASPCDLEDFARGFSITEGVITSLSDIYSIEVLKKDNGIEQTWEFAHPNNQKNTGPLNRFKTMIKGKSYVMLLNHLDHKVVEIKSDDLTALFEVTVLDRDKVYYKFKWAVEKYIKEGPLKDCWLTTMVSAPMPLGSSV